MKPRIEVINGITYHYWGSGKVMAFGKHEPETQNLIGPWKWFYINGILENEGTYSEQGEMQDLWIWNNRDGRLKLETIYII